MKITPKHKSRLKWVLISIGGLVVLIALAIWIFLTFYLQHTLNTVVIPKIQKAAYAATHKRFVVTIGKISFVNGTFVCNEFALTRVGVDSSEHGMGIDKLTIDSARIEGVSWWGVLWGKDLTMKTLALDAPRLYVEDMDSERSSLKLTHRPRLIDTNLSDAPTVSLDSIMLRKISVFLPERTGKDVTPIYRDISVKLTDVLLDPNRTDPSRYIFSRRVEFDLPRGSYSVADSMYSIEIRGVHGSLSDSLVTVDSFAYRPNYSEQGFADRHKYLHGQLTFETAGIRIEGIDFAALLTSRGLHVRKCEAASWGMDFYCDRRKPHDPHPPDAVLPHKAFAALGMPITVESIVLNNGLIKHREREPGSVRASLLTFTKARVNAHPFCTDTSSSFYAKPLTIDVRAYFLGQAELVGTVTYPLHQKAFDLHVAATVGELDLPLVNAYLVSNERKQVTGGKLLGGSIRMDVRSGTATTTISPRYTGLSIKLLPKDVHEHGNIFDGLKSFLANTFVLRTENLGTAKKPAISATTTYRYSPKEEFFEFIWLALRRSIGKVVGF